MVQAAAKGRPVARQDAVQNRGIGDAIETDAGADDTADREDAEPKAEDVDEHDPGPENRCTDADEGDDHRTVVERPGTVDRRNNAGRDADDERDDQRGHAELDRRAEELTQL